jgi:hypothetical protein
MMAQELEKIPTVEGWVVEFMDGNADVIEEKYNKLAG